MSEDIVPEKKYFLFDDEGSGWEVYDMEGMLEELFDDDVENFYKSTRYFHELEMAKIELIELGLMTQESGPKYDAEAVILAAEAMANEIIKRSGQETLDILDSEVDVTWKATSEALNKYRQKN